MQAEPAGERRGVARATLGELGEEAELDGAQQHLRPPEAEAELHDGVRRRLGAGGR